MTAEYTKAEEVSLCHILGEDVDLGTNAEEWAE